MRRMDGEKGRKGRRILTWSLLIGLTGALLVTSWQNVFLGKEKGRTSGTAGPGDPGGDRRGDLPPPCYREQ